PTGGVADAVRRFEECGIGTRPLGLVHGFHSPLVDPILDPLESAARRVTFRAPSVPLVSNVTGALADDAPTAGYWRNHARQTVRFADGMQTLASLGCNVFLEVGPGSVLIGLGRQALPDPAFVWTPSLARAKPDAQSLTEALQALYLAGVPIDWDRVHEHSRCRRVSLPTYPFERRRFWIDAVPRAVTVSPPTTSAASGRSGAHHNDRTNGAHAIPHGASITPSAARRNGAHEDAAIAPQTTPGLQDWFYRVRWVDVPLPLTERGASGIWLVLADYGGV